MRKKLISALAFIIAGATSAFALDTNEVVSVGVVTDFEAYYGKTFGQEGSEGNNLEFTMAGGILESLSWFLGASFIHGNEAEPKNSFDSLGFNLLWTPLAMDAFEFDIMPNVGIESTKERPAVDPKISYPNGDKWTFGVDFEFNLTALSLIQPYLQFGFDMNYNAHPPKDSNDKAGDSLLWEIPLALGAVVPVTDTVEFLVQFSTGVKTDWNDEGKAKVAKWSEMDKTLGCGLNFMITERLEGLTEVGWNFGNTSFNFMGGVIYSI